MLLFVQGSKTDPHNCRPHSAKQPRMFTAYLELQKQIICQRPGKHGKQLNRQVWLGVLYKSGLTTKLLYKQLSQTTDSCRSILPAPTGKGISQSCYWKPSAYKDTLSTTELRHLPNVSILLAFVVVPLEYLTTKVISQTAAWVLEAW